jgi:hypothetical protein
MSYGTNMSLAPNSYVEALSPSVAVFGDMASKEIIKVTLNRKDETLI